MQRNANSCARMLRYSANLAPTWSQNGTKYLQKRCHLGPQGRQNGARMGSRRRKNRRKTPTQQKRGFPPDPLPHFGRKWCQHGPKLAPKMEPRWLKKSIPNSIIFLMSLGIDVWAEFGGFVVPKWSQVGTKMGSKIDVYLEGRFF